MVEVSGLTQRQVDERAGFSRGYLSQLLARNLDLKLWHVLAILDVFGRSPGDFFTTVYPSPWHPALGEFKRRSQPLTEETDELLKRLYSCGVDSLGDLRGRLARCEQAVARVKELGFLDDQPPRKPKSRRRSRS